jgi:RecJ-like exonuclease
MAHYKRRWRMDSLGPVIAVGIVIGIIVLSVWSVVSIFRWIFGSATKGIRPCPHCNGTGHESRHSTRSYSRRGAQPTYNETICSFCEGRGKMRFRIEVTTRMCPDCKGGGYRAETRVSPPGVFRKAQEYPVRVPCHYAGDRNYDGSIVTSACRYGRVRRTEEVWETI